MLALARRSGHDLHAGLADVFRVAQFQVSRSPAKELGEIRLKACCDLLERDLELAAHDFIQLANDLPQAAGSLVEIRRLGRQKCIAIQHLSILVGRVGVHRAHPPQLRLDLVYLLFQTFRQSLHHGQSRDHFSERQGRLLW